MTLSIPPGYAEIGIGMKHPADPDPWVTTFGVAWAPDILTGTDYLGGIVAAFSNAWKATLSSSVAIVLGTARIGQDGGDPVTLSINRNISGESSAAKLPQNCALLVQKQTALGGRKGKGRMFLPGMLNESKVDAVGAIDADFVSDLQITADLFLENLGRSEPGGWDAAPMVLLHNSSELPTLVDGLRISPVIATQRRRLRK